jgi:hypothetical protein
LILLIVTYCESIKKDISKNAEWEKTKQVFGFAAGFGTMSFIVVFILFPTYIPSGMDAFIRK